MSLSDALFKFSPGYHYAATALYAFNAKIHANTNNTPDIAATGMRLFCADFLTNGILSHRPPLSDRCRVDKLSVADRELQTPARQIYFLLRAANPSPLSTGSWGPFWQ